MSSCAACVTGFEKDKLIVVCVICQDIFHATGNCAGLTAAEIKVVELKKKPRLVFKCSSCHEKGSVIPLIFEEAISNLTTTVNELSNTCTRLESLRENVYANELKVNTLMDVTIPQIEGGLSSVNMNLKATDSKVNDLECLVSDLNTKIVSSVNEPSFSSKEDILAELRERISRSHNLIFFNIPDYINNLDMDKIMAKDLISLSAQHTNIVLINVRRLGNFVEGKCRPLLVALESPGKVSSFLKGNIVLPNNIKVSSDRTTDQRKHLNDLRTELAKLNSENPRNPKTIKYIKGIPKIIDISQSNAQNFLE